MTGIKEFILSALFILSSFLIYGQKDSSEVEPLNFQYGMFPKEEPTKLRQIQASGFYRFFGTYTQMHEDLLLDQAANVYGSEKTLFIGDDSQLPTLWVSVGGKPSPNSYFGFDIFSFQFLDGQLGALYSLPVNDSLLDPNQTTSRGNGLGSTLLMNLGMNLSGKFNTDFGSFKVNLGGTNWYHLSDLTFSAFRGFNRFGLFERNPWDPVQKNLKDRYQKFFAEGAIQQDQRWGNRAFQGLMVDGTNLPNNMTVSFLHGKSQIDGGISPIPNTSTGGRLRKDFKSRQFISLNSFNNRTYSDSLNNSSIGFNVHTFEFFKNLGDKFHIVSEIGAGRYYAPGYESEWGEAINFKFVLEEARIPLELHYFRISPNVINNNAIYFNTSINEVFPETQDASVAANQALFPFASSVVRIGQMTNNRTGVNLNGEYKLNDLSLNFGYGISQEIEAKSNIINYGHPVNGLTRSRFWRWNFPENVGPYNRYNVIYRDVYDSVEIKDTDGDGGVVAKHFSNAEIQAKYKRKLFGRDLFMMFLGQYATVQSEASLFLVTNEDAYLRLYSSELEMYYFLSEKLALSTYTGYERSIANYETDTDLISRRPRNQTGFGIGAGLELSLGANAIAVLKHRNFEFKDTSFSLDRFKGSETLVEIKVFF